MPRHATPRRRCCRGEVARRWRNLISRLMSLLIAHPSPRRLFIGADRDRPWLVVAHRTVSSLRFLLFNLQDLREREGRRKKKEYRSSLGRGREGTKTVPSIGTFHPWPRVKNRDADTSLVFLSCHCTTCSYIFQRQTSDPSTSPRVSSVCIDLFSRVIDAEILGYRSRRSSPASIPSPCYSMI